MIIFAIGILVTAATISRLVIVVQLLKLYESQKSFKLTPDDLAKFVQVIIWAEVELNLALCCANLPAFATLWKTLNTPKVTYFTGSGKTHQYHADAYALGNRGRNAGTVSTKATTTTSSQERIVVPNNDIVRSTEVVVNVERES